MNIFVLFLCSILAVSQGKSLKNEGLSSRIVNGEDVTLGEIPYQVSLQTDRNHFCGGSIVNEYWIVTAGHCVKSKSASIIKVIVGTVSLENAIQSHQAAKIIMHEKYKPTVSNENDIALIKVSTPFEFSDIVAPVKLPEPYVKVKTNSSAVVSGWGRLESGSSAKPDILQKVRIYIADQEYCSNVMEQTSRKIFPSNVCAYDPTIRRGQCNGDSGGPLTVDGKLTGVVSWSVKDPICASTKFPGVYTRVSEFVDWILEHAQ